MTHVEDPQIQCGIIILENKHKHSMVLPCMPQTTANLYSTFACNFLFTASATPDLTMNVPQIKWSDVQRKLPPLVLHAKCGQARPLGHEAEPHSHTHTHQ